MQFLQHVRPSAREYRKRPERCLPVTPINHPPLIGGPAYSSDHLRSLMHDPSELERFVGGVLNVYDSSDCSNPNRNHIRGISIVDGGLLVRTHRKQPAVFVPLGSDVALKEEADGTILLTSYSGFNCSIVPR